MLSIFAWQVANENLYANATEPLSLDWALPGFGRGFAVNCLFMFMNESHYIFVYWLVGTFDADVETVTLSVGIVRCFESVGSALAFGIGAARVNPMVNLVIAFVAFAVCIVPTYMVTFKVPEHPREKKKNDVDPESRESIKVEGAGKEITTCYASYWRATCIQLQPPTLLLKNDDGGTAQQNRRDFTMTHSQLQYKYSRLTEFGGAFIKEARR